MLLRSAVHRCPFKDPQDCGNCVGQILIIIFVIPYDFICSLGKPFLRPGNRLHSLRHWRRTSMVTTARAERIWAGGAGGTRQTR